MKHLGDVTKINGGMITPVDVITFGSPCQDLSIAGKRKGLSGERSGLLMEAIRIIREMKEATNGRYPSFAIWENVPGALSSNKGEDFRTVLEELIRIREPDTDVRIPASGKWEKADCFCGESWSIAWRILDAQYWGVPQRRRRIALIMDFAGRSAPEILFIRESLRRDLAAGKETWEGASSNTGYSFAFPDAGRSLSSGNRTLKKEAITFFSEVTKAPTECKDTSLCLDRDATVISVGDTVYCIQGNVVDRNANQHGVGIKKDIAYTLNTTDKHAVCAAFIKEQGAKAGGIGYSENCSPTLKTSSSAPCVVYDARGNGDGRIAPNMTGDHQSSISDYTGIVCLAHGQANAEVLTDRCPTLTCNHEQPVVAGIDCRNLSETSEVFPTLQAKDQGGYSLNYSHAVRTEYRVRRLTPLECERLQGFPDHWTDIPDTVTNGKRVKASDSARYRAMGNSIAIPPWKWVLKRVSAQFERDATLGSLFDGIGGFPYIWEQMNQIGSVKWASEIEPFPIAVTSLKFIN